jgi:hypothetical protein
MSVKIVLQNRGKYQGSQISKIIDWQESIHINYLQMIQLTQASFQSLIDAPDEVNSL